jgi:tetratricopeptide (TPR) repeat protein
LSSKWIKSNLETDDPLLHYSLGIIQQHSEQHSSALLEFKQTQALLEAEGDVLLPMVLVHQAMASCYIELEQPEEALQQLQLGKAIADGTRVDPTIKHSFARPLSQGELVWQMAEAYASGDDLPNSEKALREALRQLPYNQAIYTKLADVCFRQGKLDEALASLEDLADYHENRQDLDKAIEVLENALKLAPDHINIGARLAQLYIRRGYPDKGVEGLIRVAEQQRKNGYITDAVASLQQAGEIRWMQGKADETLQIYDRIVQIAPGDVEARQWRAIMYTLAARTNEAIAEKKQIANILAQRKDYDNAIAELHQIIGLDTADTDAYYMLGDMLMRRGEYKQALNLYTRMSKMADIETERIEALIAAAQRLHEKTTS